MAQLGYCSPCVCVYVCVTKSCWRRFKQVKASLIYHCTCWDLSCNLKLETLKVKRWFLAPFCILSLRPVGLRLGLSVLSVAGLLGQACGHGGRLHHSFEAALSLLDVLLRVEDDDVDLGDVEHAQGHGGAQAHGDRQSGGLDEHLQWKPRKSVWFYSQGNIYISGCHRFFFFISEHRTQWFSPRWMIYALAHVVGKRSSIYGFSPCLLFSAFSPSPNTLQ